MQDSLEEAPFTLLVADDNEFVTRTVHRHLSAEGYRIVTARDGSEALRKFEQQAIDLVLLDIRMPGIDGLGVLKALRRLHSPSDLPILMATGNGKSNDVVEAFELGANDYVTKPFDYPVLLARIHTQLRSRTPAELSQHSRSLDLQSGMALGTVLDERYRLDAPIGQGQFGTVYRATHLQLQRLVAIKVLDAPFEEGKITWERFHQEGVSLCRLQHPNAVSVLDFSATPEGTPFLVMELLQGQTLDDELVRDGSLSPRRAVEIALPVCEVLAEAHELGIIHRDIKPHNIFLHQIRQGEMVKVLDFGIAKLVGQTLVENRLTLEGKSPGSPAYMAPERFSDIPYDGRADIYSLGVTLFEALTGRPPFMVADGNPMKLALLHLSEPPPLLRTLRPEVPQKLEEAILATLEKNHEDRPDATELAKLLAEATGLVVVSPPVDGAQIAFRDAI
jgi:serine/threonine protein kinase